MPPPPPSVHGAAEPTVFQKRPSVKMGATMGGLVGITIGAIFGTVAILRSGAGPRGFLPSLSGYMLSSAATFAFFMSIGTVIRTDGLTMSEWAQREVREGRLLSPGGNGGSAVIREWERRRNESR